MDGREGGFYVVHRKLRTSRLYRALSAEQRSVFHTLLMLAYWKEGAILIGETWHPVKRGEVPHSLETIATESAASVKVVRTTLSKLFADDRPAGGRGPFITERWLGMDAGRPRRVLTIVNYDQYQDVSEETGTTLGTMTGSVRAQSGHDRGTTGAPNEPREPVEPVEPTLFSGADAPARETKAKREASPEARERRVIWERLFLADRGEAYRWGGPADQLAANALAPVDAAVFEAKALRGLRGSGFQRCSTLAQLKAKWNDLAGATFNGVAKHHVTAPADPPRTETRKVLL